ncbi:MAG: alanine--tRNA ligase [Legionellales bacterium]|nr:alanine--tRNA ligase [Legionellales bacterium]|tara:strand:+ start:4146 stop:6755 length:2610 start_codon:yes stop_codon:yes gene_type:complete
MVKSTKDIRQAFLDYFAKHDHEVVHSASLIPNNDPTLLFVNAGMVPFKDVFLGHEQRPYSRATSSQRCVRAGGKHNDLDQVGYTARHHTFFEMLGNFSFGDYFKREAIKYSWDFLTNVLQLPAEKLWVTVFEDDDETADIWLNEMGVDPARFSRCGEADNFWSMGDSGPCGPCTEIFYDHGEDIPGGPPGSPEQDGDRYIEIWNLVFMQYDRLPNGVMEPLPKPSVDTGMGLERIAAVMQGVHNNYEIDLFQPILQAISKLSGEKDLTNTSMRVIADHIRSCAFLIADGVIPSNEGRGYVLRRIVRRAIRHGHKLGLEGRFFAKLVEPLVAEMGEAYPILVKSQTHITHILQQEEDQFARTLDQGLQILEQDIAGLKDKTISGQTIFKLYDTYGFPADLTGDIARERGLQLDLEGFKAEMEKQRSQSKQASKFAADYHDKLHIEGETEFKGYDYLDHPAKITGLYKDGNAVDSLVAGDKGIIIMEQTPFYAESGGQVGDQGFIDSDNGSFSVHDTQKRGKAYAHFGEMTEGTLKADEKVHAKVDLHIRHDTALNHSATHLLHAALRELLGSHVMQKGSLVEASRLRFDFAHHESISAAQLREIEDLVNDKIRANMPVTVHNMAPEEAIEKGALALFGEKYGDEVRVLEMGDFSMELCGGTHVDRTGDIGFFKITSESGIAAGVRRIEAITGRGAIAWSQALDNELSLAAASVKATRDNFSERLQQLLERNRNLEKQVEQLRHKLASGGGGTDLLAQVEDIGGIKVLATKIEGADSKSLRNVADQMKDKLQSAIILLATVNEDKVNLVAGVTKDCTTKVKAGDLVNHVASQVGGKGGGRPDMAMAGGNDPAQLDAALASVKEWITEQLNK